MAGITNEIQIFIKLLDSVAAFVKTVVTLITINYPVFLAAVS
jgi:hypothetical protein